MASFLWCAVHLRSVSVDDSGYDMEEQVKHTVWSSDTQTSTAREVYSFEGFDSLSRSKSHATTLKRIMPDRFFFVTNDEGLVLFRAVNREETPREVTFSQWRHEL